MFQYYFRWADEITIDRRIKRLFEFGHIAEAQIEKELHRVGCITGDKQYEYIGFAGHWQGHIDGTIYGVPGKEHADMFLTEYKTHNDKNFKILKKQGVLKGYPGHYDQCQRYLSESPDIKGAMYIGYNKNDSDYYIEFIDHDVPRQNDLKRKESHIMMGGSLFPRIGTGQITWFECQFCNFKKVCFGKKEIRAGCRTCKSVEVHEEGRWRCGLHQEDVNLATQAVGCQEYELDTGFFSDQA